MSGVAAARARDDAPRSWAQGERVTVRRALIAGGATWALLGGGLMVGMASAGTGGRVAGMLLGLVCGGMVASAWLLIALCIDLWTRQPLGRRRVVWTVGVTLATMISPVLPVTALSAGG